MAKAKAKTKSKSRGKKKSTNEKEYIIIDETNGLIFENEEDLFGYFEDNINALEDEYQAVRSEEDLSDDEQVALESYLESTLDEPDEIWQDSQTFEDLVIHHFIRSFEVGNQIFHYIAIAYVTSDDTYPSFVFIHFPTKDLRMLQNYQRGELIYDKKYEYVQAGAIDGDALGEGDPLSMGLYIAMMKVRSEKDIDQEKFKDFQDLREDTIESADEIWKKNDLDGNVLVTFIKEYPDHEVSELTYVVVTQEDSTSNVHSLLFSFPTNDSTLVDRYRQGENLQAEEVVQESSH
ncbi:PBECR2 nuclease fold domain-containing protein [Bdellovibrio sp. HCB337]|uniref:PBECR2 nuclease fold domain-containing protein n=1 Tax=Bdellovibrio sp. HCB337 TaxID=3394358 RepID=UPI0039A6FB9A